MLDKIKHLNVLIIGDAMLDIYDWGKVERISPEAPVPILNLKNTEYRFGGAANVALNIKALGANPILCSVIGTDTSGDVFMKMLEEQNLSHEGILRVDTRPTITKRRVIAGSQHMIRIDDEKSSLLPKNEEAHILEIIKSLIDKSNVVIFEDYDKGVISENIIAQIVSICNQKNIPVTVDPKKRNFLNYKNVSLFKPNLKELKEGLKLDFDSDNISEIVKAIEVLDKKLYAKNYLITLSENGVLLYSEGKHYHTPAHIREISDVSGAGDTVIAVASLFLALGLSANKVAQIANLGGGLVCEHVGAVSIDKDVLIKEAVLLNILD